MKLSLLYRKSSIYSKILSCVRLMIQSYDFCMLQKKKGTVCFSDLESTIRYGWACAN